MKVGLVLHPSAFRGGTNGEKLEFLSMKQGQKVFFCYWGMLWV